MGALPVGSSPSPVPSSSYDEEIGRWKAQRLERLRSETGWLTLVGLYWLEPGASSVGSDPASRVVLPAGKAPARVGILERDGDRVTLHALPGSGASFEGKPVETLTLRSDVDGEPSVVSLGSVSFLIIRRADRLGVRVRDTQSATRLGFRGLESFPVDAKWRVEARFEPHVPPRKIPIPNVLGTVIPEESPGALVFDLDGQSYRLDAVLETGEVDLFIIFADRTNGTETYGAGRFLYAAPPANGRTVLDFNKAYNPPCAFTPFATCPLPPRQNRLPVRVTAGEKKYGEH